MGEKIIPSPQIWVCPIKIFIPLDQSINRRFPIGSHLRDNFRPFCSHSHFDTMDYTYLILFLVKDLRDSAPFTSLVPALWIGDFMFCGDDLKDKQKSTQNVLKCLFFFLERAVPIRINILVVNWPLPSWLWSKRKQD